MQRGFLVERQRRSRPTGEKVGGATGDRTGAGNKNHSMCQRRSGQAGTLRSDKRQPGAADHRTGRRRDGGSGYGQGKPGPVMQRRRTHQSSETVKGETETENVGTKICKGRRYFRGNSGGRAL